MTSKTWIRRLLCLLLCLAVLAPCASALGETTKVAAYLLRLRAEPSKSAKVLDAYPRGTVVTILKKGTNWTKVRVHGKEGYMQSDLLAYAKYKKTSSSSSNTSTSSSSKTKVTVSTGDTMYVMKGIRLNLREDKNNGPIISSFRGGTPVTILKKGRYWSFVEVKGLQGYMANEYLTDEKE